MPNLMAALPNIGGALSSTPQIFADAHYTCTRVPCSNVAKTRNPLKLAGVPQTNKPISAVGQSSPYYKDFWGIYCCLRRFFPIVDACINCEDIARRSCAMVPSWRIFGDFLRPVFSASRMQHVSLPNTGGALCSTPQSLADARYTRCRAVTLPRRESR